mgnify:FL=1
MEDKLLYNLNLLNKLIAREFICNNKDLFCGEPSATQMIIMDYILNHQDEDIYQKDLEEVLHLRRATVSGVLQTMEKHELVERVLCDNDIRCKKIILKEKAKKMFDVKKIEFFKLEKVIKKGLSDEEIEIFCHIIESMQNNINEYVKRRKD